MWLVLMVEESHPLIGQVLHLVKFVRPQQHSKAQKALRVFVEPIFGFKIRYVLVWRQFRVLSYFIARKGSFFTFPDFTTAKKAFIAKERLRNCLVFCLFIACTLHDACMN